MDTHETILHKCPVCGVQHDCKEFVLHIHVNRNGQRKHYRRCCCCKAHYDAAKAMPWTAMIGGNGNAGKN